MGYAIIYIVIGFIILIKGADFLVEGSSEIAKKFGIPEIIIGLTIVSIGTSMPELFVSSTSTINGSADMAIGNIIGSNICNLLLILGLSTLIRPVKFPNETKFIEIPMCLFVTVFFAILCNTSLIVSRIESVILIILFVMFIAYTIIAGVKEKELTITKKNAQKIPTAKNVILIILGIIGLKYGGDLTVENAVVVANHFGLSEKVIGLTILAIGTSLPELVTSVTAAIKGNSEIAIGNIIGSNLFNILLIIGVSGLISPLAYNATYNLQFLILIVSMIMLSIFPYIKPKDVMGRFAGAIYILMYLAYMVLLFIY